jgi:CTP:molybdopterin cytidylyltransferase MocA
VVHTQADVVLVAAGDMPLFGMAKRQILGSLEHDSTADAAVLVDAEGVKQPLAGAYRRHALVRRAAEVPDARNRPAKLLLDGLRIIDVVAAGAAVDCDTWDDVYRIEEELRRAR